MNNDLIKQQEDIIQKLREQVRLLQHQLAIYQQEYKKQYRHNSDYLPYEDSDRD